MCSRTKSRLCNNTFHGRMQVELPTTFAGITASIKPKLVLEISGEYSITATYKPAISIAYDSDTGLKTDSKKGAENAGECSFLLMGRFPKDRMRRAVMPQHST